MSREYCAISILPTTTTATAAAAAAATTTTTTDDDDDDDDDDKVGFLLYARKIKDLSQSLCEYQRRFTDDLKTSHNERLI